MDWSVQRPARRAAERDEAAIRRWVKQDWPGSGQNSRRRSAWIVFLDESGQSLTPVVRRTWAPRGHTPVLRHRFRRWQRVSMAELCCYGRDRSRARLAVHAQPGAYTTEALIAVIGELRRFLHGAKVILVWDNLPAHCSKAMRQFLATQRTWLVVEYLPTYAPELNPVEGLWANLKAVELANLVADTLQEVLQAARRGVSRVRHMRGLLFSFLDHTGLSL